MKLNCFKYENINGIPRDLLNAYCERCEFKSNCSYKIKIENTIIFSQIKRKSGGRIKNWKKISENSYELIKKPLSWKGYVHSKIAFKKGYSDDWVLLSQYKVLLRAKTKTEIKKKTLEWMRMHSYMK